MARLSDSITYGNHAITGDVEVGGVLSGNGSGLTDVATTGGAGVGDVSLFAGDAAALNVKYGQGWRIADGTDGTPDLIDSFPKLGTFAQKTGTGGAKNITPAGGVSVSVAGHTLSVAEIPSHNHGYFNFQKPGSAIWAANNGGDLMGLAGATTASTGSSNSHSHGGSGSFSGTSHTNEPQFTYLVPLYFTGVAGTYP